MKTYRRLLRIEQRFIDNGEPRKRGECPYALAITEMFGEPFVVMFRYAYSVRCVIGKRAAILIDLSHPSTVRINAYDCGKGMVPHTARIAVEERGS